MAENEKKSIAKNIKKDEKDEKTKKTKNNKSSEEICPYHEIVLTLTQSRTNEKDALRAVRKEFNNYKKYYVVKSVDNVFSEEEKKYTVTAILLLKTVTLEGKTPKYTIRYEKDTNQWGEEVLYQKFDPISVDKGKETIINEQTFALIQQYKYEGFRDDYSEDSHKMNTVSNTYNPTAPDDWVYNGVWKVKVQDKSKDLGNSILSDETKEQAKSVEKDSGGDFLSGKSTSAFAKQESTQNNAGGGLGGGLMDGIKNAKSLGELNQNVMGGLAEATVNGVTQAAGSTLGAVGAAAGVAGAAIETATICATIVTDTFSYVSKELMSYVGTVVADLASIDLSKIVATVSTYLTAGLQTPDEMLKELMTEAEKALEDAQKAAEDEAKNAKMAEMKQKAQEFQQKVDTFMNNIQEKLETVTSYIEAGPDWLEEKIDDLTYKGFEQIGKYAGIATYTVNQKKEEWINGTALAIAEKQAKKINEVAKNAQKKIMDEAKKLIAKLKAIAMALIAKALMLIMGLLGG